MKPTASPKKLSRMVVERFAFWGSAFVLLLSIAIWYLCQAIYNVLGGEPNEMPPFAFDEFCAGQSPHMSAVCFPVALSNRPGADDILPLLCAPHRQ
jgi:hypothetical protein